MKMRYLIQTFILLLIFQSSFAQQQPKRVLVFSKVTKYYHESIPTGAAALHKIGSELGAAVDTTSSSKYFTEDSLKKYAAVVFLNTSGNDLLDRSAKADFERFIQAGGGFMGVHGAAATEYGWPWYGRLLGAVFNGHPKPQDAIVKVANKQHPSTKHLPKKWKRFDEWYNFKYRVSGVNVLLQLDESSYEGGADGPDHPIAWYQEYDGGRSFYTGLGHTHESYSDPKFIRHLLEGLKYAMGNNSIPDYSRARTKRITESHPRILVFTKTKGWHHASIPFGVAALRKIAQEKNYSIDTSVDANLFNDDTLKKYDAVIFLSTTGNVLNSVQQAAFERFIQAGGGYMGIHSAADTEYDWPWYGNLVGAYFESHPHNSNIRKATIEVTDKTHAASSMLPDKWERTDEWYNYKSFYTGIKVLASLDENTYEGGTNGAVHPISWHHEYDGGRSFYTGLGHTDESYSEPLYLRHLEGGIKYVLGNRKKDYSKAYAKVTPEQNRFVKTVLADNLLDYPMELAVAPDGRVFYTELKGKFSMHDPKTGKSKVLYKFPTTNEGGTGLIGVTLDPGFMKNRWIYLYYTPGGLHEDSLYFNLSRFTLKENNTPDLSSEKILLSVKVEKNSGSHHGGSLAWDKHGNLFLSTGDGTSPFPSEGYAPLDERPGKEHFSLDAQRSASNTNDLKGKILRINPEPDGTYTIPEGNLFPKGMEKTRPEIYVMGTRNPYRIAVNPNTSVLYWGEIGPDAGNDSERGPRGYDEFNQAKKPGNFGWPYFVGENLAYSKWDFVNNTPGPKFDPAAPINNSVNNTGINNLPPAISPFISYPYAASEKFPELGLGGRCAIGGDFYQYNPKASSPNKFPEYYDGKLFIADWMRNWVFSLEFDKDENYKRSEPFMPANGDFRRPIDMEFGEDGLLYMLEYGSVYGASNVDARLVRIEYFSGNRPPVAKANIIDTLIADSLNRTRFLTSESNKLPVIKELAGQPPFTISVGSRGSMDLDDDDSISIQWLFDGENVGSTNRNAKFTYDKKGIYYCILKVTDKAGLTVHDTLTIKLGNTKPDILISSPDNKSFAWKNKPFRYSIKAKDKEDGNAEASRIKAFYFYNPQPSSTQTESLITDYVNIDYPGKNIMAKSDCKSCHILDKKAVGPSYIAIANRYKRQPGSIQKLAAKIIEGGAGNWGKTYVMSAHPQLSVRESQEIVKYIFSLTDKKRKQTPIPLNGQLNLPFYEHEPRGQYTIVASYTDKGGKPVGPLKGTEIVTIRNADVKTIYADDHPGFGRFGDNLSGGRHKAYLFFRNIDLTGIKNFKYQYTSETDGEIEVRIDSRAGPIISNARYNSTKGSKENKSITAVIDKPVSGRHDVYFFVLKRQKRDHGGIINLKEIGFGR